MDASSPRGPTELPSGWTWERFKVVDAPWPSPPPPTSSITTIKAGRTIALHSRKHGRFIRMHRNGRCDASGRRAAHQLPSGWTWERFEVVDAGNGEIALHCKIHNRFMRMNNRADMDVSAVKAANALPRGWTWERFTVRSLC